jgi:hypothetical protein
MTLQQTLTFYDYVTSTKTESTEAFQDLFRDDIPRLPEKVTSSITIRKHLTIDTIIKERVFQTVFMEYFKEKLYSSL